MELAPGGGQELLPACIELDMDFGKADVEGVLGWSTVAVFDLLGEGDLSEEDPAGL